MNSTVSHLARRFFGSLTAKAPDASAVSWVHRFLSESEFELWERMDVPDRVHSIQVAEQVVGMLPRPQHEAIAAALLHDVGKIEAGLGTWARVLATLVWTVSPDEAAYRWAQQAGVKRQLGQYRLHPEIGSRLCSAAGSAPLVSAWAAQHHRPPDEWTVPEEFGLILKRCDDD